MLLRSPVLVVAGLALGLALIGLASIARTPDSTTAGTFSPTPIPTACAARLSPPVTSAPTPYNPPQQPGNTYRDVISYSFFRFCNDDGEPASKLRIHMASAYSQVVMGGSPPGCPTPDLLPVEHNADEFELVIDWHTACVDPVEQANVEFHYAGNGPGTAWVFCYTWFDANDQPLDAGGSCPLIPSILGWGQIDCKGSTGFLAGAMLTLRASAGLPYNHRSGCPDANTPIVVGDFAGVWGDFDCDGTFAPKDALLLLLHNASLAPTPSQSCPTIGAQTTVSF